MKYLITYITYLFAALLLFSCTDDVILTQEIPDVDEAGTVYITLSLSLNTGSSTRTAGDEEDEHSAGESGISNIRLMLVGSGHQVYEVYTGAMQWTSTGSGTLTSALIPVKGLSSGQYYAYLVANATSEDNTMQLPTDALSYTGLTKGSYSLSPANAIGMQKVSTDNYFLMANVHNTPNSTDFNGGVKVDVTSGYTKDNPLHINIPIERMAAKISTNAVESNNFSIKDKKFRTADPEVYYAVDKISLDGIGLLNCATRYNLIQQWSEGSQYATNNKDLLLLPPAFATDDAQSSYYNRMNEYLATTPGSNLFQPLENTFFCMENSSPDYLELNPSDKDALPGTRMKGRTTGMLFRVKVKIGKHVTTNEGITPDDQEPGGWTRAVSTDYPTFYKYKGELFAELSALAAAYPDLSIDVKKVTISELRDLNVEVFENGTMYYLYWLSDDYYTNGGESYYAVTRNTWYHLTLIDIKTIGNDVPGGSSYLETDPIDYQVKEIAVSLKCAVWKFHQYENNIK